MTKRQLKLCRCSESMPEGSYSSNGEATEFTIQRAEPRSRDLGVNSREKDNKHTVTHVGSTTTIHITTLNVSGAKSKVGEFDNNTALLAGFRRISTFKPAIRHNKVLWLDVPMEHAHIVAKSNSLAHLRQQVNNKERQIVMSRRFNSH